MMTMSNTVWEFDNHAWLIFYFSIYEHACAVVPAVIKLI